MPTENTPERDESGNAEQETLRGLRLQRNLLIVSTFIAGASMLVIRGESEKAYRAFERILDATESIERLEIGNQLRKGTYPLLGSCSRKQREQIEATRAWVEANSELIDELNQAYTRMFETYSEMEIGDGFEPGGFNVFCPQAGEMEPDVAGESWAIGMIISPEFFEPGRKCDLVDVVVHEGMHLATGWKHPKDFDILQDPAYILGESARKICRDGLTSE